VVELLREDELVKTSDLDQAAWNHRPGPLGWIQRHRFTMVADLLGAGIGRLLEVGYGSGVFLPELASRCRELHGADVHDKTAEVAAVLARRGITAVLTTAPAEALPYGDGRFDAVVAVSSLEFVDDAEAASRELRRVLAPTGVLVVVTPGHSPVLDAGLKLLTGERAEDTFQGRRQLVLAALAHQFSFEAVHRFPPVPGLWLYTVVRGRPKT